MPNTRAMAAMACLILLIAGFTYAAGDGSKTVLEPGREIGVFFLGNSYTGAGGGQYRLVPQLLQAGQNVVVRVGRRVCAGETLRGHLERNEGQWPSWREKRANELHVPRYQRHGKTSEEINAILEEERAEFREEKGALDAAIANGAPWDYIILQVGKGRYDPVQYDLASAVDELVAKFHALFPNGTIILYSTWADQDTPELQHETTEFCRNLARKHGLRLAPVGDAMHPAHAGRPDLQIFRTATDSHPGNPGGYLAACVLYATITGQSPVGLPARLDIEKNPDPHAPDQGVKELFEIDEDDAQYLQEIAWKACTVNQTQREARHHARN